MIKFNNLNNLSAYLKKTEAEEIYMKKINSINLSFTTLLNSITSKFHEYDNKIFNCQLSIHSNSTDIASLDSIIGSIESNTGSMYFEIQDMSDVLTAYTDNYETYTNEIANELSKPEVVSDIKKMTELSKEQRRLTQTVELYQTYKTQFFYLINSIKL